jgi:hypothetical protein
MKSLKTLLAASALVMVAQSAMASQTLRIEFMIDAKNVYAQQSETEFAGQTSNGHFAMSLNGNIDGTPINQSQDKDLGESSFAGAALTLLPNNQVRFTGTNGITIVVASETQGDGSFTVKPEDVAKALKVLMKAQLEDFASKMSSLGVKSKISIKGKQMTCEKGEKLYTCDQGLSLIASVSK